MRRCLNDSANLCVASSDTSEKRRPRPSCSKDCGGWNIAATTARAWPGVTAAACSCARKMGKIGEGLARLLKSEPVEGNLGIGHTRWATHGPPSDKNSHPHLDQSGKIAVVHNGVIENYDALKQKLLAAGHKFKSDTDTEVLAHLIGDYYEKRRMLGAQASRRRFTHRKSDTMAEVGNPSRIDPGRLRRAARSHRHLRPRGDFRRPAGHHRRRAARFAAHHRHRHGREFSGQRRQCHCRRPHQKGRLS